VSDRPRRAVFLDRDGTISEEMGYMNHLSRFHLFPFAAAAIKRLNEAGWPVVVVTNQSGCSRGFFPEEMIHRVHDKLTSELTAAGARLDAIYYCPHQKTDNCTCRKPLLGMLERAAAEHGLALPGSWIVSDRQADLETAEAIGGRSILVLTGYGRGEYEWNRGKWARQPDFVAENLAVAVDTILSQREFTRDKEPA
jgi:D-glycero-D-manno-heptose 1,7-bisphosphate phosphatase